MRRRLAKVRAPVFLWLPSRGVRLDRGQPPHRYEGDEFAALMRGLKLGVIAVVSAVLTAALVIGWGERQREPSNPYYGELVTLAMSAE